MEAIGGYFELETGQRDPLHPNAVALNSARNCLRYLLNQYDIQKLWVPSYTCPVVWEAAIGEGCLLRFYEIDEDFLPRQAFAEEDYVLYTNYFGICSRNVASLFRQYPRLIVDNAQSFYNGLMGMASFNSPRKFFGVPDGGYLYGEASLAEEVERLELDCSCDRFSHLIRRIDLGASAGYSNFQKNDASLCGEPVKRMSPVTHRILGGIDYEAAKRKRLENFSLLHAALEPYNALELPDFEDVPMVYPFLYKEKFLRRELIASKIFVASYWSGQRDQAVGKIFENYLLPLPIDQRYGPSEMEFLSQTLLSLIHNCK